MRICKVCKQTKEYIYFTLNAQGACLYKDEFGYIWHGRKCYECHKTYVKHTSDNIPLIEKTCSICATKFKQKAKQHKYCSDECKKRSRRVTVNVYKNIGY